MNVLTSNEITTVSGGAKGDWRDIAIGLIVNTIYDGAKAAGGAIKDAADSATRDGGRGGNSGDNTNPAGDTY